MCSEPWVFGICMIYPLKCWNILCVSICYGSWLLMHSNSYTSLIYSVPLALTLKITDLALEYDGLEPIPWNFLATTTGYSSHSICCSFGCTCVAVQDVAVVTWTSRQHQNSSLQHVWCCFSAALRRRSLPPTLGKCSFVRRHQRLSLSRDLARPLQARLWQLRICWASCLSSTTSVVHTQHRSSFVFRLHRYDHVSDALAILHWLRLPEWVNFKLVLMAYRVLNGMAPPFLNQLVLVSSLPGHRHLRSSFTLQLHIPLYSLSTASRRSCPVTASQFLELWLLCHYVFSVIVYWFVFKGWSVR